MSENEGPTVRNSLGGTVHRNGEPTQRFSALQGGTLQRNGEPTQRFSALQQQLLCAAIHFFHRHIRSDPDVLQRMEGNQMFKLFFEVQYHNNKPDLNRIFPESVHDCSALHVCSFILSILHQGIFSVSAFIVSVIYLSRFKESSHITLHACTWRPLFLTSLLLADKMWEDKPVRNSSLAKLFPVLSNTELNRMESEFLGEIRFHVLVKPDLFCSFCEKLLAEQVHGEITRCVNQSEYAATLQADHVETAPMKPSKPQIHEALKAPLDNDGFNVGEKASLSLGGNRPAKTQQSQQQQQQSHQHQQQQSQQQQQQPQQQQSQSDNQRPGDALRHAADVEDHGRFDGRFDPVSRGSNVHQQRPGQVAAWMDASGPPSSGVSVNTGSALPGDSGIVPRSQSAGPTTGGGARRSENGRLTGGAQPLHTLVSLRGGTAGVPPSKAPTAPPQAGQPNPHPPRSISVHPLHRTESQKKHHMGKVEDLGEKSARTAGHGPPPHSQVSHSHSGPPLRRSLPAKTSGYTPLARAPSGAGGSSGLPRDMAGGPGSQHGPSGAGHGPSNDPRDPSRGPGASVSSGNPSGGRSGSVPSTSGHGPHGGSASHGPGSAPHSSTSSHAPGVSGASGRLPQSSPRSPGSVSPVLVPHDHLHNQHGGGGSQSGPQSGRAQAQAQEALTPMSAHSQDPTVSRAGQSTQAGRSNSHPRVTSAPAGPGRYGSSNPGSTLGGAQASSMAKNQASRGNAPGQVAPHLNQGGQPARASSAPRVSGITPHNPHSHSTPPGSSSVRTSGSQPAPHQGHQGSSGYQPRQGPIHVPGSPSLTSPMSAGVASTNTPGMPQHYPGQPGSSGASVVVFPASPTIRGTSPAPGISMVGSAMPMKTGRGTIGSSTGLQRNASPMGIGGHGPTPASPAGRTMSPAGNVPMSGMSVGSNRPDLLSTNRGRSPPPGVAGAASGGPNVRAPRAVTPGQIVKSIQQGTTGVSSHVQRNSFGGGPSMMVNRGLG